MKLVRVWGIITSLQSLYSLASDFKVLLQDKRSKD